MPARRPLIFVALLALTAVFAWLFSPGLRLTLYRIPQAVGHAEARYWALYRMSEEGGAGIALIARSLDDENEVVRRAAFEILVAKSAERAPAWEALLSLAQGGPIDLRLRLFRWLSRGDGARPGALGAWGAGLNDPDPEVAELAAQSLMDFGPGAWPVIEKSLARDDRRAQERACRLLVRILDSGQGADLRLGALAPRLRTLEASRDPEVAAAARDALISARSRR